MSDRYIEIRRASGPSGRYIQSGQQLPRTPPLTDVKKHLDFRHDEPNKDCDNMEAGARDDSELNSTFDFNTLETKTEPGDHAMLKGMKGYQLTPSDLDFIKKMQEEKLIKKLQGDLEEVQRLLKNEMMATEMTWAVREKAQAELKKLPTCGELSEWVKVVLETTLPSAELTDLDPKCLLAMVTKEDVQRVVDGKKTGLARMKKTVENKEKKEAAEREQLEKEIAREQLKIRGLMSELSDLKSELAQQEEANKALEMIKNQEAQKIKVEAEKLDISEEVQDEKGQVKRRGKERKKAVKSTEKLQGTTNQSKSTRSRLADGKADSQTSLQDEHANTNTKETSKTKPKSRAAAGKPTVSVKTTRGPQKKIERDSNPHESEQAGRERRKPPERAQTSAPRPKRQSQVKTGQKTADGGEEAPNCGLRRSKRIASRR